MTKLQSLLLFGLISFSLQDNNCLVNFEHCERNEPDNQVKIEHCKEGWVYDYGDEEKEYCLECEKNYAVSDDGMTCTLVENPIEHCILYYKDYEDNIVCGECEKGYMFSDGTKVVQK